MTTNINIDAHCGDDKKVNVCISNGNGGEAFSLKDGEKAERVIHDDLVMTIKEVSNEPCCDVTEMGFGEALEVLNNGGVVSREGWNGKGMYIAKQNPDEHSKMTAPYIYMVVPKGSSKQFGQEGGEKDNQIPWLASQTDIFAKDWIIV